MPERSFFTLDVFTNRIFGGNPLAVFPDGGGLTTAQMQAVARELNLSETVFVLPLDEPAQTRRLRIFTPATELPFAGHPTIGTAHLLAAIGEIPLEGARTSIVFEVGVGNVPVSISADEGRPVAAQLSVGQLPEQGPDAPPVAEIAEVLSLDAGDIAEAPLPAAVSCGVPFLFVTLKDPNALARAAIRPEAWQRTLAGHWAPHLYVLARAGERGNALRARMFAPAMGIAEDPATGAAAAALAGYLAPTAGQREGVLRWGVEQGVEMGRPSRLEVEADLEAGRVTAVRVGGGSVLVARGEMTIPEQGQINAAP